MRKFLRKLTKTATVENTVDKDKLLDSFADVLNSVSNGHWKEQSLPWQTEARKVMADYQRLKEPA